MHVIFKDYKYSQNPKMLYQFKSDKISESARILKTPKKVEILWKNCHETDSVFVGDFDRNWGKEGFHFRWSKIEYYIIAISSIIKNKTRLDDQVFKKFVQKKSAQNVRDFLLL